MAKFNPEFALGFRQLSYRIRHLKDIYRSLSLYLQR